MDYRDNEDAWNLIITVLIFIGVIALISLTSCTSMPVKQSLVAPPLSEDCKDGTWCEAYDKAVLDNLTPALMAVPFTDLCPNGINPKKFWPALAKAVAYEESKFRAGTTYKERFNDNKGNAQMSQGAFQLSLDDAVRGVEKCKAINQTTILRFMPNLICAVGIMDQLARDNKMGTLRKNLGRYWSTIRDAKVDARLHSELPDCFHVKAEAVSEMRDMP